ncbi:hypothetical protein [Bacteroides sp. AM44-19]
MHYRKNLYNKNLSADSARKGGKKPGKISRLPQGHTDCTGMRKDLGEIP